jgi:protein-disulfide isomerase
MKKLSLLTILFAWFFIPQAFAQSSKCENLDPKAQTIVQQSLDQIHAYGCCTDSISACLKKADTCQTAVFLADEVCRLASKGRNAEEIKDAINLRHKAMDPEAKVYSIAVMPEHIWGNPDSKVILSVYLCGRCPYCSRHVPLLIRTLEKTNFKDQVAINLRYFPIKAHENSTPAALAIEAAAQMNNAWAYLLKSYENFDAFTLSQIHTWVKEIGMNDDKFSELMKDASTRSTVAASKKEGLVNGVTTTPTFFINGRRIEGKFDVDSIISMVEEELANIKERAANSASDQ